MTGLDPPDRFAWQTRRPGLTMVGSHLLAPAGEGCRLTLTLELTGPASGLFGALLGRAIQRSLERENAAFQQAAQGHSPTNRDLLSG